MEINDFYKLTFLSDLQVYDKKIFFTVIKPSKKKNDYESKVFIYSKKIMEFTSGPRDFSPMVSPDGKYLAFISKRKEKKMQLMIMPLDGGEAHPITEREDISQIKWSKDSKHIYFISNEIENSKDDVKIIDSYPFYFNGKGFIFNKRPTLFVIGLKGREKKLTQKPFNVQSYDISEKNEIALVMNTDGQDIYWNNLYLLKNNIEKIPLEGSFSEPEFSPDGNYLAFIYSSNEKSVFQHRKLYLLDKNGNIRNISDQIDRSIGNSINSDSRMGTGKSIKFVEEGIYFSVTDHGRSKIYLYDTKNGNAKEIYENNQSIDFFYPDGDKIYFIAQSINMPQELYVFHNKLKQITNFNKYFMDLPDAINFNFTASDSENIEGWFISKNMEKLPTVLEIHGGPKTAYGYAFMFEMQLLASKGFNVIFMNPRGSDGYSEDFSLLIKEHYGERDFKDLMEGLDFAIKNFPIESSLLGVAGGSYGGFMTNWIVGHSEIFRAAISERSISNQISFFGTSDIGPGFNSDQIGKTPFENLEHYWEKSPLKHIKNAKTPLLIIHSDEDYRCPIEQAYQLYTSMKFFKKQVKMVIFPGENHDLSRQGKPQHRTKRLEIILEWFNDHLKK
ncbi:MAG: S9 family peptidase [Thermoplasmata archaeon]|nr:S9 family peptidase [Thermoplasmata archaeon]